ncbi:hypothetical protein C1H46_025404 [Malus baccata]|uniref:Uncharacterized protein n=1 Tax=Malus baccata TaxID=106549 RepID=A0A540LR96_MALBA|nr:hypothetical protein C1H46_025404 [Malus baccata]
MDIKGGYGKLVQQELEAQRTLVDYGTGSLGSFPPVMPPQYYPRKRYRDDDRQSYDDSKRNSDYESRKNSDHESRPEKNPRFRESGDSDDDEDEQKRQA